MRSATAGVSSHAATSHAAQMDRAAAAVKGGLRLESGREESTLKIDLSDLVLPKVDNLHVDGLKPGWFARLLGKR
jgi:hypothetical protein